MDCTAWQERLLDGGTRPADLEAHLASCTACRAFEAAAQGHARTLSAAFLPALPAGAAARLQASLRARRLRTLRWAAAAAVLVMALPAALWHLDSRPAFEVEVVDGLETADLGLWLSVLGDHAENDGLPLTPPTVEGP